MAEETDAGLPARAGLRPGDIEAIAALAGVVNEHDGLALKLNWDLIRARSDGQANDFLEFAGDGLVGYAALDGFGYDYELTGMVHPDYRRRGIGRRLLHAALAECRKRGARQLLLVCERASTSGNAFVAAQGALLHYDSAEYHLELDAVHVVAAPPEGSLSLRVATAEDVAFVGHIRARCFDLPEDEARVETTEHLNEAGSRIYLATVSGEPIGTVGALVEAAGGVYIRGLGVLPEHQRRGYGRTILARTIALMLVEGHRQMALDVATENRNALSLYQSCGFVETNCYDYYAVDLQHTSE